MIGDLADLLDLANANPAVMILGLYFAAHVGYYLMNGRIRDIDDDVESVGTAIQDVDERLQDTRERVIRVEEHTDHLADRQSRLIDEQGNQQEQLMDLQADGGPNCDPGTAQSESTEDVERIRVSADSGD